MTYIESPPADTSTAKPVERGKREDLPLVEALAEGSELQNQLCVRYRRPLLQVFLQRRIDRNAAEDLLQRTFERAVTKIRTDGLEDPSKLGGYLYRTACKLATAYWRGELARQHDGDPELIANLED
jgi:DNA-directed RNA polymerase specialized sigma24 family protein